MPRHVLPRQIKATKSQKKFSAHALCGPTRRCCRSPLAALRFRGLSSECRASRFRESSRLRRRGRHRRRKTGLEAPRRGLLPRLPLPCPLDRPFRWRRSVKRCGAQPLHISLLRFATPVIQYWQSDALTPSPRPPQQHDTTLRPAAGSSPIRFRVVRNLQLPPIPESPRAPAVPAASRGTGAGPLVGGPLAGAGQQQLLGAAPALVRAH